MSDEASTSAPSPSYYLLKAEPDSRIVKGKDVKFSVDDFEEIKTSPWEGVRNFEARNIMKEMKNGDKALFYHSNCKNPGIAAFAEVSKEAYPDYTAWDPTHPYYDVKTEQSKPKWFMIDLTFRSRAKCFVPLALLRYISAVSMPSSAGDELDIIEELSYLGRKGVAAIKGMDLVTRGRLSVQRVKQEEWDAINQLAERGGWEEIDLKKIGASGSKAVKSASKGKSSKSVTRGKKASHKDQSDAEGDQLEGDSQGGATPSNPEGPNVTRGRKRPKITSDRTTKEGDQEDEINAEAGPSRLAQHNAARTITTDLRLSLTETRQQEHEEVMQRVRGHLDRMRELLYHSTQALDTEKPPAYEGKGKGKEVVEPYTGEGASNERERRRDHPNPGAPAALDSLDVRNGLSTSLFDLLFEGPGMSLPLSPVSSTSWRRPQSYPFDVESEMMLATDEDEEQQMFCDPSDVRDSYYLDDIEEDCEEDWEDEIMGEDES